MRRAVRSLLNTPKRFITETKDLKIAEKAGRYSISNVNLTLFGGSSQVGQVIIELLMSIGTRFIFPYRHLEQDVNEDFRDTRALVEVGYRSYIQLTDFTDEKEVQMTMRDQNVVVSCIGSRFHYRKDEEYEVANIIVPRTIARAVKKTPTVKR